MPRPTREKGKLFISLSLLPLPEPQRNWIFKFSVTDPAPFSRNLPFDLGLVGGGEKSPFSPKACASSSTPIPEPLSLWPRDRGFSTPHLPLLPSQTSCFHLGHCLAQSPLCWPWGTPPHFSSVLELFPGSLQPSKPPELAQTPTTLPSPLGPLDACAFHGHFQDVGAFSPGQCPLFQADVPFLRLCRWQERSSSGSASHCGALTAHMGALPAAS